MGIKYTLFFQRENLQVHQTSYCFTGKAKKIMFLFIVTAKRCTIPANKSPLHKHSEKKSTSPANELLLHACRQMGNQIDIYPSLDKR